MDRRTAQSIGDQLEREHPSGDPFAAAIRRTRMPMTITDPRQPDNPIVFANEAFLQLTGYSSDEVIGRNCRFLQGPDTDPACIDEIRRAVTEAWPSFRCDVLNYRKDGTPFWNGLFICPVVDDGGRILFHFASLQDVTDRKRRELTVQEHRDELEAEVTRRTADLQRAFDEVKLLAETQTILLHEVDHRVKNNLQLIASLIQLQVKRTCDEPVRTALRSMLERIEALSTVHRQLYQSDDVSIFDLSAFARNLVTDLVSATGRDDIRLELALGPVELPAAQATPLALMVNELVTNVLKHAFKERGGRIGLAIGRVDGEIRIAIQDDGVGMPGQELAGNTFGLTIIKALARQVQADIQWRRQEPGTQVMIKIPAGNHERSQ